jgi:glycosyltransferase involved in cell wall biosynthesis
MKNDDSTMSAPPLQILMTSTSYPRDATDWRGLFIKHQVDSLVANPPINLSLWAPPGEISNQATYVATPQEAAWLNELMEQGGIAHLLREGGLSRLTAPIKLLLMLRQVYKRHKLMHLFHVNWLQNALPLWGTKQPALVTVLGSDLALLKLPAMTNLLRHVFQQRRCILAPNANWMTAKLEQRFGNVASIVPIPFGIDAAWYQLKRDWQVHHAKKWLVVSRLTQKKIGPLFDWGKQIFQKEHELHLFGPMQEQLNIPEWVHYHGATYPKDLQENWFPQAAGLITLSQHDEGRPQVMLEAMAAGLPILASQLPAHADFITHQQTGWLTDSQENFMAGIKCLANSQNNELIATQARNWVKKEMGTWNDCAQRYINAYHSLLEK